VTELVCERAIPKEGIVTFNPLVKDETYKMTWFAVKEGQNKTGKFTLLCPIALKL
jgi:hypothetical protein